MQQEQPPPPSPHSMHGRLDLIVDPPLPAEEIEEDVGTETDDPVAVAVPLEEEAAGCAIVVRASDSSASEGVVWALRTESRALLERC